MAVAERPHSWTLSQALENDAVVYIRIEEDVGDGRVALTYVPLRDTTGRVPENGKRGRDPAHGPRLDLYQFD